MHGVFAGKASQIFEEIARHVTDGRLNVDEYKFPPEKNGGSGGGGGDVCFKRSSEKHYLVRYRRAAGLSQDARLPAHLWGLCGFLNQENEALAMEYVRHGATDIFPKARTRWGVEAVTPLEADTIPNSQESCGLVKALMLGSNDVLCRYETELKRMFLPCLSQLKEQEKIRQARIDAFEEELSSRKTTMDNLHTEVDELKQQLKSVKEQLKESEEALAAFSEKQQETAVTEDEDEDGLNDI